MMVGVNWREICMEETEDTYLRREIIEYLKKDEFLREEVERMFFEDEEFFREGLTRVLGKLGGNMGLENTG